jgi:TPR repeat protein
MLIKFIYIFLFYANIIFCLDLNILKLQANKGDVNAQYEYAKWLEKIGGITELIAARYYIKLAADKGHPGACIIYAKMLYCGQGGRFDMILARHYFKISAYNGNRQAQSLYGLMCLYGHGGEIDIEEARNSFLLAAINGCLYAKELYDKICQMERLNTISFFEN